VVMGEPPRSQGEVHFRLFGFPVRVHPLFWIVTVILGLGGSRNPDLRLVLIDLAIWTAAVFLSILVHELGHAFAARYYGLSPSIVLYSMGGLTSYVPFGSSRVGSLGEILISIAGPVAGFLLAAATAGLARLAGYPVSVERLGPLLQVTIPALVANSITVTIFLNQVLFVSVFWGMINLLPIYPLDGGHIAREALLRVNPREGIRQSLLLSCLTAAALAVVGYVRLHSLYIALVFGYLAYMSYLSLQACQGRRPW